MHHIPLANELFSIWNGVFIGAGVFVCAYEASTLLPKVAFTAPESIVGAAVLIDEDTPV
jgi:hypothetical protein